MGSHISHSDLIYGIQIDVEVNHVDREFRRFNYVTGEPVTVLSKMFDIVLICQGERFGLPHETQTFEEMKGKQLVDFDYDLADYNFNRWLKEQIADKLHDFFHGRHKIDSMPLYTSLGYWRENNYDPTCPIVVGVRIVEGHGEKARFVSVTQELTRIATSVFDKCIGTLAETFGITPQPMTILITR